MLDEWRARVQRMRAALGWPDAAVIARVHASGASLALAAPLDQLYTATEVNEWALLSALLAAAPKDLPAARAFHAPGHAATWDENAALHTLRAFARAERQPALARLVSAALSRGLTILIDEETLSFGVGAGSQTWPLSSLPEAEAIDWSGLHDAPIALVTGSNGKTT
ncbi:MAG TPA: Mur ligase, partial [Dokdonella sp.]